MVEGWINCTKCGHRYATHVAQCPQCNTSNPVYGSSASLGKRGWSTKKKVGVGIGIAVGGFFALIIGIAVYLVATGQVPTEESINTGVNTNTQTNTNVGQTSVSSNPTSSEIAKANSVVGITSFAMVEQGSVYQVYYGLSDSQLNKIDAQANVKFWVTTFDIYSEEDVDTIYSREFDVQPSDYKEYVFAFTGASQGKEYLWLVSKDELSYGDNDFGRAYIEVTLVNGKTFKTDQSVYFS